MVLARAVAMALLGSAFGLSGEAIAGGINVNPVQIHLSERAASALLTVSNQGERVLRVQLSVSAWDQDPKGEMVLSPTRDIIFFPTFLTLEPGKTGKVRIGTSSTFGAAEKSYRIFVEELPPLETEAQPGVVAVRTRMGIPIFLDPAEAKLKGEVEAAIAGGRLTAEVRNGGNVHFVPTSIRVRGLGKEGDLAFERGFDGWYVLPGGKRIYEAALPADVCRKIATLVVEARVGEELVTRRVETNGKSCGR